VKEVLHALKLRVLPVDQVLVPPADGDLPAQQDERSTRQMP